MIQRSHIILLALLMIAGFSLRFAAGLGKTLWQDEAETTINSLQVLERGYPYDTFKGKPLYENTLFLPTDDPKYQYASTNYSGTVFERNKGWLTYYYQAIFLKLFGFTTHTARLPFLLLFPFSLVFVYVIGKKLWDAQTGIIAAALFTFSFFGVAYEYQARYYAPVMLLSVLSLLCIYRALQRGRWRDYLCTAFVLIALFYTHIVASLATCVFFFIAHLLMKATWRDAFTKRVMVVAFLFVIATTPWIVATRFWTITTVAFDPKAKSDWLFFTFVGFVAVSLLAVLIRVRTSWRPDIRKATPVHFLLWYLACVLIMKPVLAPGESLGARLFLEVNVVSSILAARCIAGIFRPRQSVSRVLGLLGIIVLHIAIFTYKPINPRAFDMRWVDTAIAYLDAHDVPHDVPIFVTFQQFPLMLYTEYNIDLVWPIRKSFFDNYPGTFYMLMNFDVPGVAHFFLPHISTAEEYPFFQRAQGCVETPLSPGTMLLKCEPA